MADALPRARRAPGWNLTVTYRTLATPIPGGHNTSTTQVPDVITYTAQARAHARLLRCALPAARCR